VSVPGSLSFDVHVYRRRACHVLAVHVTAYRLFARRVDGSVRCANDGRGDDGHDCHW
jgi:hypothetical protein